MPFALNKQKAFLIQNNFFILKLKIFKLYLPFRDILSFVNFSISKKAIFYYCNTLYKSRENEVNKMAAELTMDHLFEGVEIKGNDPRMRFRNSQDPIYVAYQYVDNQPLSKLAQSFVKEQVNGVIKFISKLGK